MIERSIELFKMLTPEQKMRFTDIEIIKEIYSENKDATLDEVKRLYDVINSAWRSEDTEHMSLAFIAHKISRAYSTKEISLVALEDSNESDLIECVVELMDFCSLEEIYKENEGTLENE
ncbi:MAG: hypothetical protein Q4G09_00170 [Clostridia bacterium]|nr:hypothetical protein [Clostridia bacterium]